MFALRLCAGSFRGFAPAFDRKARAKVYQRWCRGMLLITGGRVRVRGIPPSPPYLLVTNHLGYLDILTLGAHAPGALFVSRADVQHWPLIGFICTRMGTIYIDRTRTRAVREANRAIKAAIEAGNGVVVFAEGGASPGQEVRPFKAPLLEPAVNLDVPVHYAVVRYELDQPGRRASKLLCWADGSAFLSHAFRFLRVRAFRAELTFGDEPVTAPERKALAQALHEQVSKRFAPMD